MRIFLCLALFVALIAPAHADQPERLTDRPVPAIKLVSAIGWRLSAVATMDVEGGRLVVKIEGDVFNVSDSERASPTIRLAVRDETGRELYHWTVLPDLARIKPGDYAPFSARVEEPPEDMHSVAISTVDAETPSD